MENKQGFRTGSVPERDPQLQASQLSRGQRMEVLSHSCGVCWTAGLRQERKCEDSECGFLGDREVCGSTDKR